MSTAIANYGEWESLYANVLLEPNEDRLSERIAAAEPAIRVRLKVIAHRPADDPEKPALTDALGALQVFCPRRRRMANPIP
jgi:hypothetical protein